MEAIAVEKTKKQVILEHWQYLVEVQKWNAYTLEAWRGEFEKRLSRDGSFWDKQYAQLHIDAINEILFNAGHAD